MSILKTEALVVAKDDASGTLKKIAGEFDKLSSRLANTKELAAASKTLSGLGRVDTKGLSAASAAAAQVGRDLRTVAGAPSPLRSISAGLKADIAALRLSRAEIKSLSSSIAAMQSAQDAASAGIGNPKIREQLRTKDASAIEDRVRRQVADLHAQRQVIDELSGRREEETARRNAKARLAVERKEAADRLRAAREVARAARKIETEAAQETAREKVRIAREGARALRETATREAGEVRDAFRARRQEERAAQRESEAATHRARHLTREVGHGARAAIGLGGAYTASRATHYAVERGAEGAAEDVREKFQGFTPEQIEHTRRKAVELSARFPSVSALKIREYQRKATSVTGDYHHAEDLLEDMVRTHVMLGVGKKGDEGAHEVETLVQASEGLNRASSAAVLRPILNAFVKAKTLYGDTVRADSIRDYVKQAGTSTAGLDDAYLTSVVPSMLQENAEFGVGQMTALGQLSRPVQKKAQIASLTKAGLLGKDKRFVENRIGRKNPYTYASTVLTDALKRQGVNVDLARDFSNPDSQEQRLKLGDKISQWFPDRKAALFWEKHILDKTKLDRNIAQSKNVVGNEGAETAAREDPYTAGAGITSQFDNLIQTAAQPGMKVAGPYMQALAAGMGAINSALSSHPEIVNKLAPLVAGAVVPPVLWGAGKAATAIAGDGTGVLANTLRVGGKYATRFGRLGTRALPGVGQAMLGYDTATTLAPMALEFGRVATGGYWRPGAGGASVDELVAQRNALRARAEGVRGRVHPSMRENFNPEIDRLEREIVELNNRIAARPGVEREVQRSLGTLGSSSPTTVGPAVTSFGLKGPVEGGAGVGQTLPVMRETEPYTPPSRRGPVRSRRVQPPAVRPPAVAPPEPLSPSAAPPIPRRLPTFLATPATPMLPPSTLPPTPDPTAVGPARSAFGLHGPIAAPPGPGPGFDLSALTARLASLDKIEASVKPDQIVARVDQPVPFEVTVKTEATPLKIDLTLKAEPGTSVTNTTMGPVTLRSAGTSMPQYAKTGSGFVRGGV